MPEKGIATGAFLLPLVLCGLFLTACSLINKDIVNNHEIRGRVKLCTDGLNETELVIYNKVIGEKRIYSDIDGNYIFTDVEDGTYTLTPIKEGYQFTPAVREVTINQESISNQDFITIITFSKSYFEEFEAKGYSIEQTPDCGYIVAGYINKETGAANYDCLIMKLDQYGEIEWSKEFGSTDGFDSAYSVVISGTEGYVFTGDMYGDSTTKTNAVIKKINTTGDTVLWSGYIANSGFDQGRQIINSGSGFTGVGFTDSAPAAELYDFMMYSVDSAGNVSSRTHGDSSINKGYSIAVHEDSGGGFIASGSRSFYDMVLSKDVSEGEFIKVDINFNEMQISSFRADNNGLPNDFSEFTGLNVTPGGSYISVGRTKPVQTALYDMWVLVTNSSLVKEKETIIDRGFNDGFNAVRVTSDTGFIAGGYSQRSSGGGSEIVIIKFDSEGAIEWEKSFPGSLSGNDEATSLQQTSDGGFVVLGFSQTNETKDYIRVIKTDRDGRRLDESQ